MDNAGQRRLRSELIRLATIGFEDYVSITLIGGEHYLVHSPIELVVGRTDVRLYPRDGGEVFFPFTNVSSIEVH